MKNSDIVNIDMKVAKYIQSFDFENRMNVVYDLAFKMSIVTREMKLKIIVWPLVMLKNIILLKQLLKS